MRFRKTCILLNTQCTCQARQQLPSGFSPNLLKRIEKRAATSIAAFFTGAEKVKTQEVVQDVRPVQNSFIPITRRTLIEKILENEELIPATQHQEFVALTEALECVLAASFYGMVSELKQLYDPLNPDKETISSSQLSEEQRLDNEFWLLKRLGHLLNVASYQELSREVILRALEEHPVYEGVSVSVDMENYDVLRFWVLNEVDSPLKVEKRRDRMQNYYLIKFKKWPTKIRHYKRVVLAVRTKKAKKLMLKSFKDIPTSSLEYFLPEGKIKMLKFDQQVASLTVSLGILSIAGKIISKYSDYIDDHTQWLYVVAGIASFFAFRAWNAYQNRRNKYLVKLSKLLYFTTVANNRALLSLVVHQAEDELFKSTLIAYTFIRAHAGEANYKLSSLTREVNKFLHQFDKTVTFESEHALKKLEELGLINATQIGDDALLAAVSLNEAIRLLPAASSHVESFKRQSDFDIEEITMDSGKVLKDIETDHGWE